MSDVTPIRSGIIPEIDAGREIVDWCATSIRNHLHEIEGLPRGVALVLIGRGPDGRTYTTVNSWSPDDSASRFETCSLASTLFLQRAMQD